MFKIKELPWKIEEMHEVFSKEALELHYFKHHAGYVDKLNALITGAGKEYDSVEEVLNKYASGPLFNNAAQHYNHEFFWENLSPIKQKPEGKIADLIQETFGDLEAFKEQFITAGMKVFGSGWLWLVCDEKADLQIVQTSNADLPKKGTRLLVVDLWEHAYYPNYQNRRLEYLKRIVDYLDWSRAAERFV